MAFPTLDVMRASSERDIISHINTSLSSSKTRLEGCYLLHSILQECTAEVFVQNAATWNRLLLQILQSYDPPSSRQIASRLMSMMLEHVTAFPELSRDVAVGTLPTLLTTLLAASDQWLDGALQCICSCLLHFPGACTSSRNKIESVAVSAMESSQDGLPETAARCYALLPRCGGGGGQSGGGQGAKSSEAWTARSDRTLCTLHATLDQLFQHLEISTGEVNRQGKPLQLGEVPSSEPEHSCHLQSRFRILSLAYSSLLSEEFQGYVNVPVADVVSLLCRALAMTPKFMLAKPTLHRKYLAAVLPDIHISAFHILKALLLSVRSCLVPYANVINKLFVQTLTWSALPDALSEQENLYRGVRAEVYKVLCVWLQVQGNMAGMETLADDILQHAIQDATPATDVVKPHTSRRQAGHDKKKNKKRRQVFAEGNDFTSEKKINSQANISLCQNALLAMKELLLSFGQFMKPACHKTIQDFILPLLLQLCQCKHSQLVVPYTHSDCRSALYHVLLACVLRPHPKWPPPTSIAYKIFSLGQQDPSIQVSTSCRDHLAVCEMIVHPRAASFCFPLERQELNIVTNHNTQNVTQDQCESEDKEDGDVDIEVLDEVQVHSLNRSSTKWQKRPYNRTSDGAREPSKSPPSKKQKSDGNQSADDEDIEFIEEVPGSSRESSFHVKESPQRDGDEDSDSDAEHGHADEESECEIEIIDEPQEISGSKEKSSEQLQTDKINKEDDQIEDTESAVKQKEPEDSQKNTNPETAPKVLSADATQTLTTDKEAAESGHSAESSQKETQNSSPIPDVSVRLTMETEDVTIIEEDKPQESKETPSPIDSESKSGNNGQAVTGETTNKDTEDVTIIEEDKPQESKETPSPINSESKSGNNGQAVPAETTDKENEEMEVELMLESFVPTRSSADETK